MDPGGYAACCRVIRDMDLRQDIGLITTPTLIIAGADDLATPIALMEDIRARIAGSELVILPNAAHILAIEQADRVNRHLLSFLGAVAA
jgi:pimeloyl-ACP methyl ester carboxylesterase